jgi:hypothetical protein
VLVRALGPSWSTGSAFCSRVGCGGGEYASYAFSGAMARFGPRPSRGSYVAGPFLSNATCSPSALISRHKVSAIEECLRLCELRRNRAALARLAPANFTAGLRPADSNKRRLCRTHRCRGLRVLRSLARVRRIGMRAVFLVRHGRYICTHRAPTR